ncbi:MAG: metal ABC transporter permease [Planctomycetota bacterium]
MAELLSTVASFAPSYWATLGIGALCAYLGTFTVLRRIVFTGAALAQAAAAGVAATFWLATLSLPAWIQSLTTGSGVTFGGLAAAVGSALVLARGERPGRLTADAMVGVVFAASSALSVLFVWRSSAGLVELKNIVAGDVLLSSAADLRMLWIGVAGVALVHARFRSEFLLVAYDPPFARTQGLSVARLERLFLGSLAIAVAVALRAAGLMLVFGTLVLPPLVGLRVAGTLARATLVAVAAAWTSALGGFLLATRLNLPVAPTAVSFQVFLLGASYVLPRAVHATSLVGGALAPLVGILLLTWTPPSVGAAQAIAEPGGAAANPAVSREQIRQAGLTKRATRRAQELADLGRSERERRYAAERLAKLGAPAGLVPLLEAMSDPAEAVAVTARESAVQLASGGDPRCRSELHAVARGPDPELATHAARVLVEIGHDGSRTLLVERLADPSVPLLLREATHAFLTAQNDGDTLGYDAFREPAENEASLRAWRAWAEGR